MAKVLKLRGEPEFELQNFEVGSVLVEKCILLKQKSTIFQIKGGGIEFLVLKIIKGVATV